MPKFKHVIRKEQEELAKIDLVPGAALDKATIAKAKRAILERIESEEADNISEACDLLEIPKTRAHGWAKSDKHWGNLIAQAQQIKADRLEARLDTLTGKGEVIGLIFRLKKLRPEYRDTYRIDIHNESLEKLLQELRAMRQLPQGQVIEGEWKELPAQGSG